MIYPNFSAEFDMLVFFLNLSLMEFQVKYLALFLLFSVIGGFGWFGIGNLHKNIQLMLQFLKGPFLVLLISYYTLMTFLMMLSVILLSMLWQQLELASELVSDLWDTGLGQEVACWFQCWKNSTSFVWLVWKQCYWCENGWVCCWGKIIF